MRKSTKSKKEPEVSYYFNAKGEKLWKFRHRYYNSTGKRTEASGQPFLTENAAIRALLQVKADLANGNVKQVENDDLTVGEWLDIWYDTHKNDWGITTQLQRETAVRLHMKPLLGKYKLQKLDKTTYKREYINKLLKTLAHTTVSLLHTLFKIAINAAVEDEILPRNRFQKVSIPNAKDSAKDNFLSPDELRQFIAAAKKYENIVNYSFILLLAYTGVRRGEALGLTWNDIDTQNKTVTVNQTRDVYGPRDPKTKNSYRTILVDDVVVKQLESYKKWCKAKKLEDGDHLKEDDYVFMYKKGTTYGGTTLYRSFDRIHKKTGIKRITPHGLRHTHASILISQRIPVNVIAARLGNTPKIVLSTYSHLFKELEEESVMAFGNLINM